MSRDQMLDFKIVVGAYRTYLRAVEGSTRHRQMLAKRHHREMERNYRDAWGVWPRHTTANTERRHARATPERLGSMVVHAHLEH
jgi:hypothetical protein